MNAAVLHGQKDIRPEQVPAPVPDDHEIVVQVDTSGICGSDIPRVLGTAAHFYPIILGHEFAGTVVRTGKAVTQIKSGDRVAGAPLLPCHRCADCARGLYAQCRSYSFIGSRTNGSWAEFVKLPAVNAIPVPADVTFEEAAMFEPSAVALHALQLIGFQGGEDVAILGGGNIGLLVLQWANILGAKSVTVFDIDDDRLASARKLGADYTVNTLADGYYESSMATTGGRGFGVVMETAGHTATMQLAFRLAANRAKLCYVGTPTQPLTYSPELFEQMHRKQFTLTGSWMSYSAPFPGSEWELTAHFAAKGTLNLHDIVTDRFPLAQVNKAFDLYRTPGAAKGKVLLKSATEALLS
jgi:L-iditol 2-dehydrogenase